MKKKIIKIIIVSVILMLGCKAENEEVVFNFTNKSKIDIKNKMIELDAGLLKEFNLNKLKVFDETSNKELVYQLLDINNDKKIDQVIFQINIYANKSTSVKITQDAKTKNFNKHKKIYAKFVPERKDDFAWENERIAFRMYGPALEATGEISNGIDVWVKSTNKLILDKWYKGEDYHKDHGEGLDYYKVGPSLGCGGSALVENDTLNKSKNFVKWNIIENGPIRTTFELSYAARKYKGADVTEIKKISLDAGENLNQVVVKYFSDKNLVYKNVIGIVKHEGVDEGEIFFNKENGIFAYREPKNKEHGITYVGVLVNPNMINKLKETDQHYLIVLKDSKEKSFTYYTGATWSKSGDFKNFAEWKNYLKMFNNKKQISL